MKIFHESLNKFKPYVEKGLVREVISPCKRLVLYNYTDHCTYEKAWDEVTLNARGTVYEIETGKVIAKAFPKFFNYGELPEEKKSEILSAQDFEVYEKMDGSLGIVYFYDGEWRVNTRGSFTSDQAIKGKEILDEHDTSYMMEQFTYLVEIVYPNNKIIVDYGDKEALYYLAAFCTSPVGEYEIGEELFGIHFPINLSYGEYCKFDSIQSLMDHLATLDHTEEGYVVRLKDGYRVKFKSAEYLALARIMSNMSPLTFWEKLDENGNIDRDFLEQLPEEFRDECDKVADQLEAKYKEVLEECKEDYDEIFKCFIEQSPQETSARKYFGLYLKDMEVKHSGAMFSLLLDNESALHKYIKKSIRPTGNVI